MPITVAIRRPKTISSMVIGSELWKICEIGRWLRYERPRSPWKMRLIQRQYWSG